MTPDQSARKTLPEGSSSCLGCLALPLIFILVCVVFQEANRLVSRMFLDPASIDVAFAQVDHVAGQIIVSGGLPALFILLLIAAAFQRSKILGWIVSGPLLIGGIWLVYSIVYEDFIAMSAREGAIRLVYRWPRPARVMRASDVKDADVEKVPSGGDFSGWDYRLLIGTKAGAVYQSDESRRNADVERALRLVQREKYRDLATVAEQTGNAIGRVDAMSRLGVVLAQFEQKGEARRICTDALAIAERGGDELGIASAEYCLASVDHLERRFAEAEPHYRRSFEMRKAKLDSEHPDLFDVVGGYANVLEILGREEEAGRVRGSVSARTLLTELRRTMSKEEAEAHIREMLERRRRDREK